MARNAVSHARESAPASRPSRPGARRRAGRRVDRARRAEIGAERRSRTRAALLNAALELFGQAHGRATRIEDVCARARVARGTFYNHFAGIEALLEALSDELTRDFDDAVHAAFEAMESPVERTCAAIRYYLHGAIQDPRWGWAMVNSSVRTILFGERVARRAQATIQEGIDAGDFSIESAVVGRDILLGAGLSGTLSLLTGATPPDYPEKVARQLLLSLGAPKSLAASLTRKPLRDLPRVAASSRFFRGALGSAAKVRTRARRARV
jgi:AcrR family transcriptional regulator